MVGAAANADEEKFDEDDEEEACRSCDSLSDSGSESSEESTDYEREMDFELLVTRVCKRWREVALAIPSLWSTIVYEEPFLIDKARAYLERSQDVPLTISIDCSLNDDLREEDEEEDLEDPESAKTTEQYANLKAFLDLVHSHSSRWRSFELMVSFYALMQLGLETLASCPSAPMLEVLQLYHYEDGEEVADFSPAQLKEQNFILFHGNAPRLSQVALWGVHLDWAKSGFLAGLRDLELAYHAPDVRPSYRDFLRILRASPELTTLTLCQSGPAGYPVEWLQSISEGDSEADALVELTPTLDSPLSLTLSSLSNLVLAFMPPNYVIALLDRLHVPNVTSLALDFEDDDYTSVLEHMSSPSPVSSKPLFAGIQALKISGMPCTDVTTLCRALSTLQNVMSLNINFFHVDYIWLALLEAPEKVHRTTVTAGTVYCPRLNTFTTTGLDSISMRDLVENRERKGYPLKHVYMGVDDDVTGEDRDWLREHLETFDFFEGSDGDDDDDDGSDGVLEIDVDDQDFMAEMANNPELMAEMADQLGMDLVEDDDDQEWTDSD
ncbi:hypothetical protein EW026_g1155 [Hermanssonia centrifuga]|uniref:Uncharacterized protein n=1 Tax=Hermanssonia centrifuga TaxID=98765 RepID=A0A4S4KSD0_9APHY|nr:hypothetical protein EW026_g1155 [Hermanssonia centrifuga]